MWLTFTLENFFCKALDKVLMHLPSRQVTPAPTEPLGCGEVNFFRAVIIFEADFGWIHMTSIWDEWPRKVTGCVSESAQLQLKLVFAQVAFARFKDAYACN